MTKQINISIKGYKAASLNFLHTYNNVAVYTGKVSKVNGTKEYHTTVQFHSNNLVKVFTIEQVKNISHKQFSIN